jgi:enamine deaminase RidA (YjgF/YER057c/UK114 family)
LKTVYSTGLEIEEEFQYSRAVSVNDTLYTSGTAPVDKNFVVQGDDAYGQTKFVLDKLGPVFDEAGYEFADVVQARIYLETLDDLGGAAKALRDTLNGARPTLSIVHVQPFPLPGMRLELELTAVRSREN